MRRTMSAPVPLVKMLAARQNCARFAAGGPKRCARATPPAGMPGALTFLLPQ
jgi:hypothetical protein